MSSGFGALIIPHVFDDQSAIHGKACSLIVCASLKRDICFVAFDFLVVSRSPAKKGEFSRHFSWAGFGDVARRTEIQIFQTAFAVRLFHVVHGLMENKYIYLF